MRICILLLLSIIITVLVGSDTPSFAQKVAPPFSIDKRVQPTGSNLEVLLPRNVGIFKRDSITGNSNPFSGEDINVEYKSGKDTVFFGFGITDTLKDAYEAVKITRKEAVESKINIKNEQYQIGKNPSYFRTEDFMSWTRGKYFFYAKASSKQALERFMTAFPY